MQSQPISIELLPTPDRVTCIVLIRSDEPISMGQLLDSLDEWTISVREKLSKIQVQKPKIITP